jgi:hypothetical protein
MALEDIGRELFAKPEVEVRISVAFKVPYHHATHVIRRIIENLPLTTSIEVETREVVEER